MNPLCRRRAFSPQIRLSRRPARRGAAALEFAVVAGPLFLTVFILVELGRALMVMQSLEEAARAGCRVAVLQGSTSTQINEAAQRILTPNGIASGNYTLTTSPNPHSTAQEWDPVTVTITASFANTSWLPLPTSLKNATLSGTCTLAREGEDNTGS